MTQAAEKVVFERTGQVRDAAGALIGHHDPAADALELRALSRYVGDYSRGRVVSAIDAPRALEDMRALAAPQGELGQADVQSQGTVATSIAGPIDCVADIVCPVTFVTRTSGTWLAEDVSLDLSKQVLPQIAGVGSPPTLNPKLASKTFDASGDLALSVDIPQDVLDNADIDLHKLSIRRLVNAFKLAREIRIANLLTTSTTFPAAQRTASSTKWNTIATATVLGDVFAALAASIAPPTHLVFSEPVAQYFFQNTPLYQYVMAGGPLPKIVVANMRKMVAGVAGYVWGTPTAANATLVVAPQDAEAVSTARTFRSLGDAPDKEAAAESNGYLLRSFYREKIGARGSRSLVLVSNEQDVLLQGQLGGIITGVIA